MSECEVYDPRADKWTDGPALLSPRGNFAAAAAGEWIYALGGLGLSRSVLGGADASGRVGGVERISTRGGGGAGVGGGGGVLGSAWEAVEAFSAPNTARRAFACAAALL